MRLLKKQHAMMILLLATGLVAGARFFSHSGVPSKSVLVAATETEKNDNSIALLIENKRRNQNKALVLYSQQSPLRIKGKITLIIPNSTGQNNLKIKGKVLGLDTKNDLALIGFSQKLKGKSALEFKINKSTKSDNLKLLSGRNSGYRLTDYQTQPYQSAKSTGVISETVLLSPKNQVLGIYSDEQKFIKSEKITRFLVKNKVEVAIDDGTQKEGLLSLFAAINIILLYSFLVFIRKRKNRVMSKKKQFNRKGNLLRKGE